MAGEPPSTGSHHRTPTMNAIFSIQRFLLALAVLVVAWAPAATLARPGPEHAAFVAEANAQETVTEEERTGSTAHGDSLAERAI